MKKAMTIIMLLLAIFLNAQEIKDRIVYIDSLERIANEDNYHLLRIFKDYYSNSLECEVYDYYKSGKLKMIGKLKDKYSKIKQGTFVYYYENGNKESVINYEENIPYGKFYSWYQKGDKEIVGEFLKIKNWEKPFLKVHQYWSRIGIQRVIDGKGRFLDEDNTSSSEGELNEGFKHGEWYGNDYADNTSFSEIYEKGKFVSGISTDTIKKQYPYKEIYTEALPKNGVKQFYRFIKNNLRIPAKVQKGKLSGKIIVEFVVSKDGWISKAKTLNHIGYGLDEEIVRVVRNADRWNPATKRGIPYEYQYTIPIYIRNGEMD